MTNKTIIQTSVNKPSSDHVSRLMLNAPGWDYVHFDDSEILSFFEDNPIPGFENIEEKFRAIRRGEHRADLFRYYYIYLNGGFFVDLDFELLYNINDVVQNYEFVSASITNRHSSAILDTTKRSRTFNGYMYANKNSSIIYQALNHLYNLDLEDLGPSNGDWDSRYHIVCESLYHIITAYPDKSSIKLYTHTDGPEGSFVLDGDVVLGRHRGSGKLGVKYNDPLKYIKYSVKPDDIVLLFCEETASCKLNSGIQKYTRKLANSLLDLNVKLVPVSFSRDGFLTVANTEEINSLALFNGPQVDSWMPGVLGDSKNDLITNAKYLLYPELPHNLGKSNLKQIIKECKDKNIPFVSVFHDAVAVVLKNQYSQEASKNHVNYMRDLSESDIIISISESSKKDYDNIVKTPKNENLRSLVLLSPHDIDVSKMVAPKINDTNNIDILFVSAFDKRKNHLGLMKAFNHAKAKASQLGYKLNLTFVAAYESSDKPFMNKVYSFAKNTDTNIKIGISEEELESYYRNADFTVYPSMYEGYGLPIVESLSYNTPVLCSDGSSMSEVAALGGCITFDPNSLSDLARKMLSLSTDSSLREGLVAEIAKIKPYSWKDYGKDFINLI